MSVPRTKRCDCFNKSGISRRVPNNLTQDGCSKTYDSDNSDDMFEEALEKSKPSKKWNFDFKTFFTILDISAYTFIFDCNGLYAVGIKHKSRNRMD